MQYTTELDLILKMQVLISELSMLLINVLLEN